MPEVRIYKVPAEATAKAKSLLEAEDFFDVKAKCASCGSILESKISSSEIAKYETSESRGKIKPPEKLCKCGGQWKFEKKQLVINEFARTGYIFRSAASIGMKDGSFIYIKADFDFFAKNEPFLTALNIELANSSESIEAKEKIEAEQDAAATGMGGIFG